MRITRARRLLVLVAVICLLATSMCADAKSKKDKGCRKVSGSRKKACRKPSKQKKPPKSKPPTPSPRPPPSSPPSSPPPPPQAPYMIEYAIVQTQDWDPSIFTQGLEIAKACATCQTRLFASSGLTLTDNGAASYIATKDLDTGATIASTRLGDSEFGEGITVLDGKLYQLIFQSNELKVYDAQSLELLETRNHPMSSGWGLTDDGSDLILSDGSSKLVYVNPSNPSNTVKELRVTFQGTEVSQLNELEYIDGFLYANVWKKNCIAKIDATGEVVGWLDASQLRAMIDESVSPPKPYGTFDYPLNGVAVFPGAVGGTELAITGKYWNKLIRIKENGATAIGDVQAVKDTCMVL